MVMLRYYNSIVDKTIKLIEASRGVILSIRYSHPGAMSCEDAGITFTYLSDEELLRLYKLCKASCKKRGLFKQKSKKDPIEKLLKKLRKNK